MIKEENILEFQKIYKDALGIEISIKEAYEQATKLIGLIKSTNEHLIAKDKKDLINK